MLKLIRVALLAIMCLHLTASPVPHSPDSDSLRTPNNDILELNNQKQFGQEQFLEKRTLQKGSSRQQVNVKPFVYHFKPAKPKPKAQDFTYVYGSTRSSKLNAGGKKVKTTTKKHVKTTKTGKKGAGAVTSTTTSAVETSTETPLPPLRIVRPPSFNPNSVLSTTTKVTWYNGPVIGNIQVNPIFYGNKTLFQPELERFYRFVTNSSYIDALSIYTTRNTRIGRGSVLPSITIQNIATTLDDLATLQPFLRSLVKNGTITPNANSYYPIHFAPGIKIMQGSNLNCENYCGYHSTISISDISTTPYLYYAVIPDQSGLCFGACGSSNSVLNDLTSVSTHELAEAIANPAMGLATGYFSPLGWYNGYLGEINDICNGQQGTMNDTDGKVWWLAKFWSNTARACVLKTPPVTTTSTTTRTTTTTTATTTTLATL